MKIITVEAIVLIDLFLTYAKIGVFTFGGGYAMISLIENACVDIFSQGNFLFKTADAFCMAENMVLQATELGISSCIISRGEETFDSEEGRALMKKWSVPDNYICQGFVVLGYIDGQQPVSKPRKPCRVQIIE